MDPGRLTPRETEIAGLIVGGLQTKEIAERLYLSPNTVKVHLKSIFRKLGVRNRVELAGRVQSKVAAPRMDRAAAQPTLTLARRRRLAWLLPAALGMAAAAALFVALAGGETDSPDYSRVRAASEGWHCGVTTPGAEEEQQAYVVCQPVDGSSTLTEWSPE